MGYYNIKSIKGAIMKQKPLTKEQLQKYIFKQYKKQYPHINDKTIKDFIKERYSRD